MLRSQFGAFFHKCRGAHLAVSASCVGGAELLNFVIFLKALVSIPRSMAPFTSNCDEQAKIGQNPVFFVCERAQGSGVIESGERRPLKSL